MKPAVVHDFCGVKISLPLQVPKLDWVVPGVIGSCLFSRATGLDYKNMHCYDACGQVLVIQVLVTQMVWSQVALHSLVAS